MKRRKAGNAGKKTHIASDNSRQRILISSVAAIIFFIFIFILYSFTTPSGELNRIFEHNPHDSYTKQALAWRRGETKLDKNYPHLELAIYNEAYFSQHDMDDYKAYREQFGDVNVPIEDQPGNEYYVSFPPFPSVPMFLLTFLFGENTPNNFITVLYTVGAFVFAILLCRRYNLSYPMAIAGAAFVCIGSSALFITMSGGVWFQAQALSSFLTMGAFYFITGKRDKDFFVATALLACAVGCRPFQAVYFIPFAYIMAKQYNFKILRTWKFYVIPACIAAVYMWYNYIRFGNILEFGHNYLPEFMRMPAGQFGWEYFMDNLQNVFTDFPKWTAEGLQFNSFGFCFYIANPIFLLLLASLIYYVCAPAYNPLFRSQDTGKRKRKAEVLPFSARLQRSQIPEALLFLIMLVIHLLFLLLHKTLGGWQFGSRYTVDMIPAALICILMLTPRLFGNAQDRGTAKKGFTISFSAIACILLLFGMLLNIYGAVKMYLPA